MGYTTEFSGQFNLDKPLTPEQAVFLMKFNETRRMKRSAAIAENLPDPYRAKAGLPIGTEGGYFVGSEGDFGQNKDESVIDYNHPPQGQPGLWCQWGVGNKYGDLLSESHNFWDKNDTDNLPTSIVWDKGEKFYHYKKWLEYIIENFLKPWGRTLNGVVRYRGEDWDDHGFIVVKNNVASLSCHAPDEDPINVISVDASLTTLMAFAEKKSCPKKVREAIIELTKLITIK